MVKKFNFVFNYTVSNGKEKFEEPTGPSPQQSSNPSKNDGENRNTKHYIVASSQKAEKRN